jgi:hypothetical protein
MDQDHESDRPQPGQLRQTRRGAQVDDAFDVWLQRSLHQLYDSVTTEPIPPELLRLIEDDRDRRRQ